MPPTRRPWIKVDADADESDKIAGLPNHAARWGWVRMMCRAKTQRRMGVFGSVAHLRQLLGTEGRYVPDLVRAGLLHTWPVAPEACPRCASDYATDATEGDLVVHDYRREQRDPTNADRQSGYRDRNADSNEESNATVPPLSRALSQSLSKSPSVVTPPREPYQVGDDEPEYPVLAWLASRGVSIAPSGNGYHRKVVMMVEKYGPDRVKDAMSEAMAAGAKMDKAVVFGAANLLDPTPSGKPNAVGKGFNPTSEEAWAAFGGKPDVA